MLNVDDIVTDLDLLAINKQVTDEFGGSSLQEKRTIAVVDWLAPQVESMGYRLHEHRVRKAPDLAWQHTGAVYTDLTSALSDKTEDDVDANSIFATPSTDSLYIMYQEIPTALFVHMREDVNATTSVNSFTFWSGAQWAAMTSVVDGTAVANSMALSGGGRVEFQRPPNWQRRTVNDSARGYFLRWQVSVRPDADTLLTQVLPVQRSRLTSGTAHHALHLLFSEAALGGRGAYEEAAEREKMAAETAIGMALTQIRDEFDVDDSGAVSQTEINSVNAATDYSQWPRG